MQLTVIKNIKFAIAAISVMAMTACDTLMDPSVSMGMDISSGGVYPYGNINYSPVYPTYQAFNPYWGPGYIPPAGLPWRPPQSALNPPPHQPGGSFPGPAPVKPGGERPEIKPTPVNPPRPNVPTGNGQRPGGNTPPSQTNSSTSSQQTNRLSK